MEQNIEKVIRSFNETWRQVSMYGGEFLTEVGNENIGINRINQE